ncbi:uncharacterized protein LOC123307046 [Coccinella septempunctata]|uniref:uncharacterized protein LOC123307046 n=1 Tax=Coccinella septempunctata TaxID=41139 RepID=UPI001D06CB0D|nr:uncharacterized protein LOC123307046 [Coccinella septempunctata]
MGSNVSPPIAEAVMDFLLDCILAHIPFYIPLIKKYVDDIICAVPKDQVNFVLDIFNQEHHSIQFTLKEETNNSVPFLDTRVIRTPENKLMVDWYRKPSSSGRYLHYLSNHPYRQKVNMILGLKSSIERIAHPSLRLPNLRLLADLMKTNGYPRRLLSSLLHCAASLVRPTDEGIAASTIVGAEHTGRIIYASIPQIKSVTNALVNILSTSTIRMIPRSEFKVDKLYSRTKDKLTVENMSGVVYSIPCGGCSEVYVGQTSQLLKRRIAQHRSDARIPSKTCALAEHFRKTDHPVDYDSTRVLELEKNTNKRCFMEMFHIKRLSNSMNYRRDVNNLSSIYSYLIHYDQFGERELVGLRGEDSGTV